jgi:hypothetical protein
MGRGQRMRLGGVDVADRQKLELCRQACERARVLRADLAADDPDP